MPKEVMQFEWDAAKNRQNIAKHGVSFNEAEEAFDDEHRIVAIDHSHSTSSETRYYCFARTRRGIITVRFTWRNGNIRIIGAGYWRGGKKEYDKKNT
jgi:uncharacterized DUF497 family protein